jgi:hypothetical protein
MLVRGIVRKRNAWKAACGMLEGSAKRTACNDEHVLQACILRDFPATRRPERLTGSLTMPAVQCLQYARRDTQTYGLQGLRKSRKA